MAAPKELQSSPNQATKAAEQASKYAENRRPGRPARAVERIAEAQATRGSASQDQATGIQPRSKKPLKRRKRNAAELTRSLPNCRTRHAAIDVQIRNRKGDCRHCPKPDARRIKDKTVTVTVNTVQTGQTAAPNLVFVRIVDDRICPRWLHRPGGKFQPAGIVHAGEFVTRSEILRQRGASTFLERFNRFGMSVLPGFADGGLVGRLAIPTLRSPQPVTERMAATFNFPRPGQLPRHRQRRHLPTTAE